MRVGSGCQAFDMWFANMLPVSLQVSMRGSEQETIQGNRRPWAGHHWSNVHGLLH